MTYEPPPTGIRDEFADVTLRDASVQEIQLELLRRRQHNALDGEQVVQSLMKHRSLWEAVMLDRFCFSNPGKLPTIGLIKLRDLSYGYWNCDSLYISTASVEAARQLATIVNDEDWGGEVESVRI